jgi:hypothetical protein
MSTSLQLVVDQSEMDEEEPLIQIEPRPPPLNEESQSTSSIHPLAFTKVGVCFIILLLLVILFILLCILC